MIGVRLIRRTSFDFPVICRKFFAAAKIYVENAKRISSNAAEWNEKSKRENDKEKGKHDDGDLA